MKKTVIVTGGSKGIGESMVKDLSKKEYNVVLNYNNKNVIFRCIDSLKQFQERYNYEIIVVDNKSTDNSFFEL